MTERFGTQEDLERLPPLIVGLLPGWPTRQSVAAKVKREAEAEPKGEDEEPNGERDEE